jgi:hypothetical protein
MTTGGFLAFPDPHTAYRLLREAPGPSPWWCRNSITSLLGPLTWKKLDKPSGVNVLLDSDGEPRLVLPMYTWFRPLEEGWMLLWRMHHGEQPALPVGIIVQLLNVDQLRRLTDLDQWLARTPTSVDPHFVVASEFRACTEVSTAYAAGKHDLTLPPAFDRVPEFFVVSQNPALPREPDGATFCIYAIDPTARTIDAIPQDWFNDGKPDYGYQWITCATRDPATRRLLVSGFRIDSLVLNETGRGVEQRLPPK